MLFKKISIPTLWMAIENSEGVGGLDAKILNKGMKLN